MLLVHLEQWQWVPTGPLAVAGLTAAAVGAAVAGGVAADRGMGKDAPTAADKLGEDFYKVILQEEPFKSTTVSLTCSVCCLGGEKFWHIFSDLV